MTTFSRSSLRSAPCSISISLRTESSSLYKMKQFGVLILLVHTYIHIPMYQLGKPIVLSEHKGNVDALGNFHFISHKQPKLISELRTKCNETQTLLNSEPSLPLQLMKTIRTSHEVRKRGEI
jgi:hypothetical protein